jgi:hypothetical protein
MYILSSRMWKPMAPEILEFSLIEFAARELKNVCQ